MTSTNDRAAQLAAAKALREYDHALISAEGVAHFAKSFGVELAPDDMGADDLAIAICGKLGIGSGAFLSGRGGRLRVSCDMLERHFAE